MPRPTIPDRAETVLDRAEEALLEKGYRRMTVAGIAARAGVAKGAVYLDFPSKEALLDAVLLRCTARCSRAVRRRLADGTAPAGLSAALRFGLEALLDEPLLLALYLSDDGVLGGHIRDRGPQRYAPRMDWVTAYITDLQAAGLVRRDLDPQTAALTASVFTVGLAGSAGALGPLTADRLSAAVDSFAGLVAAGWETPGGRRDAAAAQDAHRALLDRLDAQIARIDESETP